MALILIVEDDIFIRQNAEWLVEDLGHEALTAGDLGEALEHLGADRPIDVLFVDIRLDTRPLGGYEVADHAIGIVPGLRVLYTSGSSLTQDMTNRFVGGGQFLQKPYSLAQLGQCVDTLLP